MKYIPREPEPPKFVVEIIHEWRAVFIVCNDCECYTVPQIEDITGIKWKAIRERIKRHGISSKTILLKQHLNTTTGHQTLEFIEERRIRTIKRRAMLSQESAPVSTKDRDLDRKKFRAYMDNRGKIITETKLYKRDGEICDIPQPTEWDNKYFRSPVIDDVGEL